MPIKITMPALSPTMEEGALARWLKQKGDQVNAGDVIAEIETDKATMEVEAVDGGVLAKIVVPEGAEGVKVNATIAWLLEEDEDASAIPDDDHDEPVLAASSGVGTLGGPSPATQVSTKVAAPVATDNSVADPSANNGGDRVIASPLARCIAGRAGLDLKSVTGSGPNGRIVKADVETALAGDTPTPAVPTRMSIRAETMAPASAREIPHSNVRKVIARRLTEADRDVPQIYLSVDMEIDRLLAARKDINTALDGAARISVNDMIIKASALALQRVPAVNSQWTAAAMLQLESIDISVAVAYEGGLITPIIFDANLKGLAQISNEMRSLAVRAREGRLKPEEYQGGGFSVSNLGMYGISHFTSIINPPQAAILAVGAGEQKVVAREGEMVIATVMTCTMTCDHRVIDGALGSQWLEAFKSFIELPMSMIA